MKGRFENAVERYAKTEKKLPGFKFHRQNLCQHVDLGGGAERWAKLWRRIRCNVMRQGCRVRVAQQAVKWSVLLILLTNIHPASDLAGWCFVKTDVALIVHTEPTTRYLLPNIGYSVPNRNRSLKI